MNHVKIFLILDLTLCGGSFCLQSLLISPWLSSASLSCWVACCCCCWWYIWCCCCCSYAQWHLCRLNGNVRLLLWNDLVFIWTFCLTSWNSIFYEFKRIVEFLMSKLWWLKKHLHTDDLWNLFLISFSYDNNQHPCQKWLFYQVQRIGSENKQQGRQIHIKMSIGENSTPFMTYFRCIWQNTLISIMWIYTTGIMLFGFICVSWNCCWRWWKFVIFRGCGTKKKQHKKRKREEFYSKNRKEIKGKKKEKRRWKLICLTFRHIFNNLSLS